MFAETEQLQLERQPHLAEAAATGFALKEAASKAIGTGFADGVDRRDFLIDHHRNGPTVRLSGVAARRAAQLGPATEPVEIAAAVRSDGEWVAAICLITLNLVCPPDLLASLPELPSDDLRRRSGQSGR